MSLRSEHGTAQREETTESGRARQAHGGEREARRPRSAERTREATAVRAKRTTESRAARGAKMSLGQKLKAIHGKVRKAVHESRERNFPESNGVAGQLLLLLCGLAAYWGALGREKLRLARRSHIRRTGGTSRRRKMVQKEVLPACLRRCGAGDRGDSCFCLALYLRHHRHL